MKVGKTANLFLNILFFVLCIITIIPLILCISISFSSTTDITKFGYSLWPRTWNFEAYKYVWNMKMSVINAYGVTIFNTVVGTVTSVLVIALFAYPISRKDFKYRNFFSFFVFFTQLFSGGTVASYIICAKFLHLSNTVWAMIFPYVMNAWYVIIMKTFFSTTVPPAIIESTKLDGAGEYRIFFQFVLPISLPGIATIALFQCLHYWGDWWLPTLYITDSKLYNLQFLLRRVITSIRELSENAELANQSTAALADVPEESAQMALCLFVMGPVLIVYPLFQKYFIQGLTVGAVKG